MHTELIEFSQNKSLQVIKPQWLSQVILIHGLGDKLHLKFNQTFSIETVA